jgi:hypothetical protein
VAALIFYRAEKSTKIPTMEKIIEYKVVGGGKPQDLAEAVNQLIGDGFEPFGNVFQKGNVLLQPMVKRTVEPATAP